MSYYSCFSSLTHWLKFKILVIVYKGLKGLACLVLFERFYFPPNHPSRTFHCQNAELFAVFEVLIFGGFSLLDGQRHSPLLQQLIFNSLIWLLLFFFCNFFISTFCFYCFKKDFDKLLLLLMLIIWLLPCFIEMLYHQRLSWLELS